MPLLAWNLERLGVDDSLTGKLRGFRRHSLGSNARVIAGARHGLNALEAAGVETLATKGTALLAAGLVDTGLRPLGDVDAVVRPEDRVRSIDALADAGWEPREPPAWYVKHELAREQHGAVFRRDGVELDLHWRLLRLAPLPARDGSPWTDAAPGRLGGARMLVPTPEVQVFHACVHAASHSPVPPVRWAADVVLIARAAPLDWQRLGQLAAEHRLTVPTAAALEYLARELEVPVPRALLERVRGRPASLLERREHIARNRPPEQRGRVERGVVAVQHHRRSTPGLLERPAAAGALDALRVRWALDSPAVAAARGLLAAAGRPPAGRRALALVEPREPRRRTLADRELVDVSRRSLVPGTSGEPLDSLLYGWSHPEPTGRWTEGPEAALAVHVPAAARVLVAEAVGHVSAQRPSLRVEVWVGGRRCRDIGFTLERPVAAAHPIELPAKAARAGVAVITFVVRSPWAPADLGGSADQRPLGLHLRRLALRASS